MAVSLSKGQGVSLSKAANDLSQITIGLGWDVSEPKRGLFGTLFGAKQEDYDLDAIAFLLGADGTFTAPDDVVFYNEMRHASGAVWLTGDNRTGDGDGDDEQIIVNLDRLPQKYARIVFASARLFIPCRRKAPRCRFTTLRTAPSLRPFSHTSAKRSS